jgi:hypothetical protein
VPNYGWNVVGDLLADTEGLARESLLEVSGEAAPALVRGFALVVQSAARLSSTLPAATITPTAEPEVMVRLQTIGRGIGRTVSVERWPGVGPADDRFTEMAQNLSRAASRAESFQRQERQALGAFADTGAFRDRLVHLVYLAGHGTRVALTHQAADLQQQRDRLKRSTPTSRRLDAVIPAVQALLERLDVFEQIAGQYVAAHPVAVAAMGEAKPVLSPTRLESALARWDIQAHRSLAQQPEPADLMRVARTQALIVTATLVVSNAAAEAGLVDRGAVERAAPLWESAQVAWALTGSVWSQVRSVNGQADPALIRAAGDVRTAIAAAAVTATGWAAAGQLADSGDLARTVNTLRLGVVASVDVAHVMRAVAVWSSASTPDRAINQKGPTSEAAHLPEAKRQALVDLAERNVAITSRAVAAAASLQHGAPLTRETGARVSTRPQQRDRTVKHSPTAAPEQQSRRSR